MKNVQNFPGKKVCTKTKNKRNSRGNLRYFVTFFVIIVLVLVVLAFVIWGFKIVAKIPFESVNEDLPGMVIFLLEFGVAIIGIAVSVWVGLNIYNLIAKSDLASLEQQISELNSLEQELQDARRNQSATTKSILLSSLIKTKDDVMSDFFIKEISKFDLDGLDLSLLSEMVLVEEAFANIVTGYHSRKRTMIDNFYNDGVDYCNQYRERLNQYTMASHDRRLIEFYRAYLYFRRADFKFYFCVRPSNPPDQNCEKKKRDYYQLLSEAISDYNFAKNSVNAYLDCIPQEIELYIANSIGYCYYNKHLYVQESGDLENALHYCEEACLAGKAENVGYVRSIYYRNYAHCIMLNKKDEKRLENALAYFKKSLEADYRDAKAHYNVASVMLKIIVEAEGLGENRQDTLDKISIDRQSYWKEIDEAIKNLEWALKFDSYFTDPYFLLTHAYTLKMLMADNEDEKESLFKKAREAIEAYKDLCPLESGNTYLFYERNMYEAMGESGEAQEKNDELEGGDSEKIKKLYDNTYGLNTVKAALGRKD